METHAMRGVLARGPTGGQIRWCSYAQHKTPSSSPVLCVMVQVFPINGKIQARTGHRVSFRKEFHSNLLSVLSVVTRSQVLWVLKAYSLRRTPLTLTSSAHHAEKVSNSPALSMGPTCLKVIDAALKSMPSALSACNARCVRLQTNSPGLAA